MHTLYWHCCCCSSLLRCGIFYHHFIAGEQVWAVTPQAEPGMKLNITQAYHCASLHANWHSRATTLKWYVTVHLCLNNRVHNVHHDACSFQFYVTKLLPYPMCHSATCSSWYRGPSNFDIVVSWQMKVQALNIPCTEWYTEQTFLWLWCTARWSLQSTWEMLNYQDIMFDYMVPFLRSNSFLSLPINTLSGL